MNEYDREFEILLIDNPNTGHYQLPYQYDWKLSEEFLRKYNDRLHWYEICKFQTLSENFIREFQDKVYWDYICSFQNISENFIIEFQDKVHWDCVFENKKLSKKFLLENLDKNWIWLVPFVYFKIENKYSWATFL